jgi:RND family efflux transporter MFP subunit
MNSTQFRHKFVMVIAAAFLISSGCSDKHPDPVELPPAVVEVAQPLAQEVTDYQVFTARTQAVDSVDVKARVTGYLAKINFKDGEDVKEGQVLFEIDDRPYKANLEKAKADLEIAKAGLEKNEALYEIEVNLYKTNKGATSQRDIDRRKGERDESAGAVKQSQAAIDMAQLNYGWCKVIAPIGGRINQRFVSAGNLVTQDATTLTNIVSLKPIWAFFDADQNTVDRYQRMVKEGKIKAAHTGQVPVKMGLALDVGFPMDGVIDFVSNQLDPNTGSIRVRGVFPNVAGNLVAGMFTRIQVPMSVPHSALLVSDRAIGTDQGQRFILAVNDKNEVEYRQVEVGQNHNGLREVLRFRTITEPGPDGKDVTKEVEVLKPTDRVIVNGLQRVRPGATVEPRPVDMATLLSKSSPTPTADKNPAAKSIAK